MTFKVKVNDLHFQYQLTVSQDACLVQIWWFSPKSVMSYRVDKPNFQEFWVEIAKITLTVKVNDSIFNTSQDYPRMHVWWFQLKSTKSYHADKVNFTDRQMDGQMDRRKQRQCPFGLKGIRVYIYCKRNCPSDRRAESAPPWAADQIRW